MTISNTYRIITNDRKFRVQRRRFRFFWQTLKIHTGFDMYEYVEFDCKKEALGYIADLMADDEMRRYYKNRSKRKWKVLRK